MKRTLEPEVMDSCKEAMDYDAMDHQEVNETFANDFIALGNIGLDLLDLGTGTARIPVAICKKVPQIRIMASDAAQWMLDIARYNLEVNHLTDRIQLQWADAKKLIFQKDYFDSVISNSLVHHLPDHDEFFSEIVRVLRPNGLLFIRDLYRPETEEEVEELVKLHGGNNADDQQLLRQSFHAALTVAEVQEIVQKVGIPAECVEMTSNRHWTLAARISDDKKSFTRP